MAQNGASGRVGLKEIAEALELPPHFLSKILQLLVRHKLLNSSRGSKGGFMLEKAASTISLLDVVAAVDGMDMFDNCVLGMKECSDARPCPIHNQYKPVKEDFLRVLSQKSLEQLAKDINSGKVFLIHKK